MIFVTVGSSLPHDGLIYLIDHLIADGDIKDDVIMQIGNGTYIPRNAYYFRFKPSLELFYKKAEVIVSSCGAGTLLENVKHGRRVIAVQNPDITGGHEMELIDVLWKREHILFCRHLHLLPFCIENAKKFDFKPFKAKKLNIKKVLRNLK